MTTDSALAVSSDKKISWGRQITKQRSLRGPTEIGSRGRGEGALVRPKEKGSFGKAEIRANSSLTSFDSKRRSKHRGKERLAWFRTRVQHSFSRLSRLKKKVTHGKQLIIFHQAQS